MGGYVKPWLSYEQQIELIETRGVVCQDEQRAIRVLQAVGITTSRATCTRNRSLTVTPKLEPKDLPVLLRHLTTVPKDRIYSAIAIVAYLTRQLCPDSAWVETMADQLTSFPMESGRYPTEMGTPDKWQAKALWQ